MTTLSANGDYILGTGDEEIARLGLQHVAWRSRALAAWRLAGFTVGQTLLDIGCGPGHASVDLAEIVGPGGRVLALDRSPRFLQALQAALRARRLEQVSVHELDLEDADLPRAEADGAWCRWILAFLKWPRKLLARVAAALRPGAALVVHEYFDYGTWRVTPRSREIEDFVAVVMESWRADGGEPDIGLDIPQWLVELGFELRSVRPVVDIVSPSDFIWQWPKTFFHNGLRRLVEVGQLTPERAWLMSKAFAECETTPNAMMVTPGVVEIVATRR
jgi:SAM-dependent methyltransferase